MNEDYETNDEPTNEKQSSQSNSYAQFVELSSKKTSNIINDPMEVFNDVSLLNEYKYVNNKYKSVGLINKYLTKDGLVILQSYALRGMSGLEIAEKIGITQSTLYDWKRTYPQINYALSQTKEVVLGKLEQRAIQTAMGYTTNVIEPIVVKKAIKNADGRTIGFDEVIEYAVRQEHIKGEWQMQQFLLKNIAPDRYKGDAKAFAEALSDDQVKKALMMQENITKALNDVNTARLLTNSPSIVKDDDND